MRCYSSNIQAFVLSERFNRAYLICENYWYNGLAKDASLGPHSQDSFTLVDYDTVYLGTVKVDFTDHPEDMYEVHSRSFRTSSAPIRPLPYLSCGRLRTRSMQFSQLI